MPFISSMRESFGPQARRKSGSGVGSGGTANLQSTVSATLNSLSSGTSEIYGGSSGLTTGTYNIIYNSVTYPTFILANGPDNGGWMLAYNLVFNESWIQGQRGPANSGSRTTTTSYNMNGFWTSSAPGKNPAGSNYDMTISCRAPGAYVNIDKILIMYHTATNVTQASPNGLAWGYYTRASGISNQPLQTWFNNNTRNVVWSSGNRTATLRTSWTTPYGNSLRNWPGGGDLFVDNDGAAGISDPINMANYNLVLNGDRTLYGYSSTDWNDSRFTTTFANGTFYGHTMGGIGVDHNNSNYWATALAIGLYDYCDGRRTAIYGNGTEAVNVSGGDTFGTGCLNATPGGYNTAVLGVSIFVK